MHENKKPIVLRPARTLKAGTRVMYGKDPVSLIRVLNEQVCGFRLVHLLGRLDDGRLVDGHLFPTTLVPIAI
jgi:hypothetical protein